RFANTRGTALLLVSKTGSGKSSLANALLKTTQFQVGRGMLSCTESCKRISTRARGRDLTVVDTPGTMDVADEEKAKTEIRRAIGFCPEGFDVFLVVLKCDAQFTAEERRAIEVVAEMFGDEFYKHAIVVFSHGDEYKNNEFEFSRDLQSIRKQIPYLDQLLTRCGNRFALVDNGRRCDRAVQDRQIEALLSKVENLVVSSRGRMYTTVELEAARRRAEEAERERGREKKMTGRNGRDWSWKSAGKSSLANALLDTKEFQVGRGMLSGTAHCKCISTHARGRDLTVVDTPGTMDVADEEKAKTEIRRAISFCPEGFDIFLVVLKCDARFTAEERRAIEVVAEMFGAEFYKHAIVVFSHGDEFDNNETEFRNELQEIRKKIQYLDQLLTRCGNRFALVDNGRRCDRAVQNRQIETLLSKAEGLVASKGGRKYTSLELEAERRRAEEAERKKAEEAERREKETREQERREMESQVMAQQRESDESRQKEQFLRNIMGGVLQLGLALASSAVTSAAERPPTGQLMSISWSTPMDDSDDDSD
uniref:AIG1-type G domain-containing protein n=1 Tax=Macrostomum lignano TaxID=282301 RepID=A0A1I8GBJ0_9PLAT